MVLHHFKQRFQSAAEALQALGQIDVQEEDLTQPPSSIQLPQAVLGLAQSPLPSETIIGDATAFILSPESYNRLEKILLEFIGPVAPRLLRQVVASVSNCEELINKLALHLTENQQIEFKKRTIFLMEKSTLLQELTVKHDKNSDNLSSQETQIVSDNFVHQCEQELVNLIGPIAIFLVRKAIKSSPQISRVELVKILAEQIPEHQKSLQFQQRLLS
jgi:serine/threonine-protein kinase